MKRRKKLRYPVIDKSSLAMRKLARVPMPPPVEKHRDKKNDYRREKRVDSD